MKKFMVLFGDLELCVYADTKEQAGKTALSDFISRIEKDMKVCEMKARTERCDICQMTYIPSKIMERDGEKLCVYCYDTAVISSLTGLNIKNSNLQVINWTGCLLSIRFHLLNRS